MIKLNRLLKSFIYAFRGLFKVFREEQNLRVQAAISILVIILAWFFNITNIEWSILFLAISIVILMEIINSAIERITDVLKPRINNYVKEIKDIMAAAVMTASVIAVIIGILIFWPYWMATIF